MIGEVYMSQTSIGGYRDGKPFGELLEYPFQWNNAGKEDSKRPKQDNDCTVIALSIATGITYDEAYDHLKKKYGRKCNKGCFFPKQRSDDETMGYTFTWQSFQAVKGQRRMNPSQFCKDFAEGTYIVKTAKHVFVISDGVAQGTLEERPDRCIYGCWKVEPV